MAKKNPQNIERRAMVEKMRAEQARKEKLRSFAILGFSIAVVVALLVAALIPFLKDRADDNKPIKDIGVAKAAASCDPVKTKTATGNNQHETVGKQITYPDAPPAFGPHWGIWPGGQGGPALRQFYTTQDRPEVEYLVHSLEHGNTIVWYDDTVKPGTKDYAALKDIADKVDADRYLIVAPWTKDDGGSFPDGKHIALTHWTAKTAKDQKGVWEYCGAASGAVVEDYMKDYPKDNAPEGGVPQNM